MVTEQVPTPTNRAGYDSVIARVQLLDTFLSRSMRWTLHRGHAIHTTIRARDTPIARLDSAEQSPDRQIVDMISRRHLISAPLCGGSVKNQTPNLLPISGRSKYHNPATTPQKMRTKCKLRVSNSQRSHWISPLPQTTTAGELQHRGVPALTDNTVVERLSHHQLPVTDNNPLSGDPRYDSGDATSRIRLWFETSLLLVTGILAVCFLFCCCDQLRILTGNFTTFKVPMPTCEKTPSTLGTRLASSDKDFSPECS